MEELADSNDLFEQLDVDEFLKRLLEFESECDLLLPKNEELDNDPISDNDPIPDSEPKPKRFKTLTEDELITLTEDGIAPTRATFIKP